MRRTIAALVVLLSQTMVGVSSASAGQADNEWISGSDSFVMHRACVDPVLVETSWREVVHTFYDRSGEPTRLTFTGTVTIEYTNLSTGAAYSPNSSGPGTVDLGAGELVLRGSNGFIWSNDGVLLSTTGRLVVSMDETIVSHSGHVVEVCSALGSNSA